MTALAVVVAVACVCLTALIGGRAALRVFVEQSTARQQDASRRLDIAEREVVVKEREIAIREEQAKRPVSEPMPADLVDRVRAWDDEFAQEAERSSIMGLYAELQDWEQVRAALPPLVPVIVRESA